MRTHSWLILPAILDARAADIGKPHSTPIILTSKNFDEYINDPANGLWLLKFYAPWCGHCKKLEPVLKKVAPFLAGKMAIGKIDCTVEKKLCKRFDVRGYPTLKYYRDGSFQDYPLGRDADSIITFGEKLSNRAVQVISSYTDTIEILEGENPVAFLAYDPEASLTSDSSFNIDASGATDAEKEIEKLIQSTERTVVFGQVARKYQALGSFELLSPDTPQEEVAKFFDTSSNIVPSKGFIARIEKDVPIKLFAGSISTETVSEFFKTNRLPSVIELGRDNFRFVGKNGKPLVIGVYDPNDKDTISSMRQEMKQYAIKGHYREKYLFSTMDGKKLDNFLSQFSIYEHSLPEIFVLDVSERKYWKNPSSYNIIDFINAIQNGDIESKRQDSVTKNPYEKIFKLFVKYLPWSLLAILAVVGGIFHLIFPRQKKRIKPIHPPPPSIPSQHISNTMIPEEENNEACKNAVRKKDQ